jgi:predicted hydrocarbon binding protein
MHDQPREVSIPAAVFDHLRAALAEGAGEAAGIAALHAAGFAAGEEMYDLFDPSGSSPPSALGATAFWTKLARFFGDRGWGELDSESPHPGIAVLVSDDWAEADASGEEHSTCAFTSGVLSYLLSRTAGAPVAVLETSCRARGDDRCAFAFGSERSIQGLYTQLVEGHSFSEALARL